MRRRRNDERGVEGDGPARVLPCGTREEGASDWTGPGTGSAADRARPQALPARPASWWLAAAYLALLHLALGALVAGTDLPARLHHRWVVLAAPEFDGGYRRWAEALARSDAHARPGALVFLGDSIVRDLDTSSMARHTLNLAIPGDTTAGLLERVRAYGSVRTARGVVIGVGVNDLYYRPVPEAVANYRGILEQVPAGTPVLVLAALPVDERAQPAFRNADVRRLDEALEALCGERPGCRFVDPSPRLVDGTGNLAPADHDGDGVHLSKVGHDAYWAIINAAVLTTVPPARITPPAQ
jgi:lysophospholipase L1-like esterase